MTEVTSAAILVDFRFMRCGGCKVALHDELAKECPVCGVTLDRVSSNHVGLARKLAEKREEAGIATRV